MQPDSGLYYRATTITLVINTAEFRATVAEDSLKAMHVASKTLVLLSRGKYTSVASLLAHRCVDASKRDRLQLEMRPSTEHVLEHFTTLFLHIMKTTGAD